MKIEKLIKVMCIEEGVTLGEVAEKERISRQALHSRLCGDMKVSSLIGILNVLGYELCCVKDGKVRRIE